MDYEWSSLGRNVLSFPGYKEQQEMRDGRVAQRQVEQLQQSGYGPVLEYSAADANHDKKVSPVERFDFARRKFDPDGNGMSRYETLSAYDFARRLGKHEPEKGQQFASTLDHLRLINSR